MHLNKLTVKTCSLLFTIMLITACASGPEKQKPELSEVAYKNLQAGVANYNKSKYNQAQTNFKAALHLFRSLDDREGIASSCLNIAKVYLENNERVLASQYLNIAESLITESNISTLKNHLAITESSLAIAFKDYSTAKNILNPLINTKQNNPIKFAALINRIRIAFTEDDIKTAKELSNTFNTALVDQKSSLYQARLYRFQAALSSNSNDASKKYKLALTLYRTHAHKPGIASTLHEWGDRLISDGDLSDAEDKLLRALFVRQSIEDISGSIRLLESLHKLYTKLNDIQSANTTIRWLNKLSAKEFKQWDDFINAFNVYPVD